MYVMEPPNVVDPLNADWSLGVAVEETAAPVMAFPVLSFTITFKLPFVGGAWLTVNVAAWLARASIVLDRIVDFPIPVVLKR